VLPLPWRNCTTTGSRGVTAPLFSLDHWWEVLSVPPRQFSLRNRDRLLRDRDRGFESRSLHQRVRSELDFRGAHPIDDRRGHLTGRRVPRPPGHSAKAIRYYEASATALHSHRLTLFCRVMTAPPVTISLTLWFLYRAQNAIYQGRGYSKRARDGRRLDSSPERRPDEVCSSLRNLVNLSDLFITKRRRLAP
jgi:hypothetical protein